MKNGSNDLTGDLVDTNVFIYAHDPRDSVKQLRAQELIKRLTATSGLTISAQVLNEFYSAATRPNRPPSLSHDDAVAVLVDMIAAARVVPLTVQTTLLALSCVGAHGLSWWDALIWASARENGIETVYTEDAPGRPVIEGVRFVNPFAPSE